MLREVLLPKCQTGDHCSVGSRMGRLDSARNASNALFIPPHSTPQINDMKTVSTIDDEGFTTVSKIKYKPSSSTSKGKKNRKGKPTAQPLLEETDDTRFDAFAPVLEDRKKGMFEEGKWKADWDRLSSLSFFSVDQS